MSETTNTETTEVTKPTGTENKETQNKEGSAEPFDFTKMSLDDYKKLISENQTVKGYYTSCVDSAISKAINTHDEKFKAEKLPKIIEEELKKRSNEGLSEDQIKLKEMQKQIDDMKAEKKENERIQSNAEKLEQAGLDSKLAKYIKEDSDIDFFKQIITNAVDSKVKQKLTGGAYKPPTSEASGTLTKEQFDKMSYNEKLKLFKENKDLYDKLR